MTELKNLKPGAKFRFFGNLYIRTATYYKGKELWVIGKGHHHLTIMYDYTKVEPV